LTSTHYWEMVGNTQYPNANIQHICYSAYMLLPIRLTGRPSVRLSHGCIIEKRLVLTLLVFFFNIQQVVDNWQPHVADVIRELLWNAWFVMLHFTRCQSAYGHKGRVRPFLLIISSCRPYATPARCTLLRWLQLMMNTWGLNLLHSFPHIILLLRRAISHHLASTVLFQITFLSVSFRIQYVVLV